MERPIAFCLFACLVISYASDRSFATAFASVTAGNAEAPGGEGFDMGDLVASAGTSDTDPEFGTAAADATVLGPDLSAFGFAGAFEGPAWIASGTAEFFDSLKFSFPEASITGSPENLIVRFTADFMWSISDNGSYDVSFQGLSSGYSTADGLNNNDFDLPDSESGSETLIVEVPFDFVELDPLDSDFYLGQLGIGMQLTGGAGAGDHIHGSFPTAAFELSLVLTDVTLLEGTVEVETEIASDSGAIYEFEVSTADFDVDGDVDGRDFLLWQRGFGTLTGAELIDGDADMDGDVDANDLTIWQDQYGESGHLAGIMSVPEPTTILFVAVASGVGALSRRRRRG